MKYHGLTFIVFPIMLFVPFPGISSLILLGTSCYSLLLDNRGFALVGGLAAVLSLVQPLAARLPRKIALLIVFMVLPLCAFGLYYSATEIGYYNNSFGRSESSNETRFIMIQDSWASFLDNPFLGSGSISQADKFLDALDKKTSMGVHSVMMQWLGEYGIAGGIISVSLLVLSGLLFWQILFNLRVNNGLIPVIFFILISVPASLALAGFFGYGRIVFSSIIGIVFALLLEKEKIMGVPLKQPKRGTAC
jgi:hypothetical protein